MKKLIFSTMALFALATGVQAQDAAAWVTSRAWAPAGFALNVHESVNAQEFYDQYQKNREVWEAIFTFMRDTKLDTLSVGERPLNAELGDRCVLRVTEGNTKPMPTEAPLFEHHKKYIDLQYNRTGSEVIAFTWPGYAVEVSDYNPVRDVQYYTALEMVSYQSTPDLFFLCFPSDYHMPSLNDGTQQRVKKLVVKIEYVE